MVRALIIGGGLAGLSAALTATSAGHHVVALERARRIGEGQQVNRSMVSQLAMGHTF